MFFNRLIFTLALIITSIFSYAQIVTNSTELTSAINAATPGTTITLANGTWNDVFIDIDKNGTSADPITITAQSPGEVLMTGNSRVLMEGSYLTVSGLVFQDASNLVVNGDLIEPVIELDDCNYCKIINNKIDSYNGTEAQKSLKFKWIFTDGNNNEIAYNSFIGKYGVGSIINDNRGATGPEYLKIHHNYFADRTPINGLNEDNDQDAIRIGVSTTSMSDSFSEVYDNYFYNFFGEVEIISNKSGQNKYYNNTFRDYAGTLTLRHGNNCEVYGNYFFAENNLLSGGIRVIGEGHKVYNNYIESVNSMKPDGAISNATGGINVTNGRLNSELSGYFQVIDAQVVNNTFVNCDYGLRIGTMVKSDLDQAPLNLTIANNIMYNTSIDPYQIITAPIGNSVSEGNIINVPSSDMADDGNFYRLISGGSPIDAGIGSYSFLSQDILEGNRDANFDAGAEEFGSNGNRLPYESTDVGVNIGFGTTIFSTPILSVSPSTIEFGLDADTFTFEITANVDWVLTEDLSWLSLDATSGSDSMTVTLIVTEKTTGVPRFGDIVINEIAGGSNLVDTLSVFQNNIFTSAVIPIVGTTSLGMQQNNANVSEENAYNNDLTNYWTGNPDTEAEVSITFDLSCPHVLTEIGVHFWKADERTTTFSVAIADDASGPFTTIINSATSAASGATVNTEQLFSLNNAIGRYVKFIGIGNSSSTNWTSIAHVNIYGNLSCYNNCSGNNLLVVNDPIMVGTYSDADSIHSSGIIQSNIGLVEFVGRYEVKLLPGFHAENSSDFHAYIENCIPLFMIAPDENENVWVEKSKTKEIESNSNQPLKLNINPNPFYQKTSIKYFLPKKGNIKIIVIDLLGRSVYNSKSWNSDRGWFEKEFDGSHLSDNIYFLILQTETDVISKKIILKN